MQVSKEQISDTTIKLSVKADVDVLESTKRQVLQRLARGLKLPGFRAGKAPLNLALKQVDQTTLQSEFLDSAINKLYVDVVNQEKVHPVNQPKITVNKFVPFTTLEFIVEVEVVGAVKLPDYKKIKITKKPVNITPKEIEAVIDQLKIREASRKPVIRASKISDEILIDFQGVDAKTNEAIAGASGQDYPIILGSNTFIPGFETHIVGLKAGEKSTFTITFPQDYGVKALQNRRVTFTVTVKKVNEVIKPSEDNAFAAKIGPFKTVIELKGDIKKELLREQQRQSELAFENELVTKIAEQSTVAIPDTLVDKQIEYLEQQERQNLSSNGQTWQEHLQQEGLTEEEHKDRNRPQAAQRVKLSLVLGEIAEQEKITITPDEFDRHIQLLKGQYTDKNMQAELDKPVNQRDIMSRLLAEKTIAQLVSYAAS